MDQQSENRYAHMTFEELDQQREIEMALMEVTPGPDSMHRLADIADAMAEYMKTHAELIRVQANFLEHVQKHLGKEDDE